MKSKKPLISAQVKSRPIKPALSFSVPAGEKILIVDDDESLRAEIREFLEGYEVLEASRGPEALGLLRQAHEVGLVILDVMLPGMNGLDVLTEIKRLDPGMGIIILTGHSSKDVAIEALQGHADDYIEKPIDTAKMLAAIERLLEKRRGAGAAMGAEGKVERVKRYIERNCFRKVELKGAADAVCLSPKYLSRLFKQYAGEGFNEYRLKVKMAKARELLESTGLNVNQIADKLGYENAESLIRQFKKFTRRTLTQYRKDMLRKKRS